MSGWQASKRLLVASVISLFVMHPSKADSIPGQNDPAFVNALHLWLDDDSKRALPALAKLAHQGNVAARIVIGLTDKYVSLQGPWLAPRSKAERIELLRLPGGLSGKSWLRKTDDLVFIHELLGVLDSHTTVDRVLSFSDMHEPRAVRVGLISLEARQWIGFARFADDPRFPDSVRYLIWREWQKTESRDDEFQKAVDALPEGDGQRLLLRHEVADAEFESWLLDTHLGLPLRALCERNCEKTQAACMRGGFYALGGYRRFVALGTPMASLISEEEFAQSIRGQASVLRRALPFSRLTEGRLKRIAEIDACFAGLLEDEGQRF